MALPTELGSYRTHLRASLGFQAAIEGGESEHTIHGVSGPICLTSEHLGKYRVLLLLYRHTPDVRKYYRQTVILSLSGPGASLEWGHPSTPSLTCPPPPTPQTHQYPEDSCGHLSTQVQAPSHPASTAACLPLRPRAASLSSRGLPAMRTDGGKRQWGPQKPAQIATRMPGRLQVVVYKVRVDV